jgi:hypothetical protein
MFWGAAWRLPVRHTLAAPACMNMVCFALCNVDVVVCFCGAQSDSASQSPRACQCRYQQFARQVRHAICSTSARRDVRVGRCLALVPGSLSAGFFLASPRISHLIGPIPRTFRLRASPPRRTTSRIPVRKLANSRHGSCLPRSSTG